ncbi:MAG TPA: DUF881 domain-containing protein [Marmoricola sp.]
MHRPRWATGWRPVTLGVFAIAGFLVVTSAINSHGLDLRASGVTDLSTVLLHEKSQVDQAQKDVAALSAQVNDLTGSVSDRGVAKVRRKIDRLKAPAGFAAASGPGVTVQLDDAPKAVLSSAMQEQAVTADELVVHQQDIQAVVNTLWGAGAEAITIQGQRVISTTGIKCVGNTVVLHGVPYSPPYVISAIGDTTKLLAGITASPYIQAYLTYVKHYQLGWKVTTSEDLDMPAYKGTSDLRYATVDTRAEDRPDLSTK